MNTGYRNGYLNSAHWFNLRRQKLASVKHCEYPGCNSHKRLDVHHIRYKNLFDVSMDDLMVLCRKHHNAAHEKQIFTDSLKGVIIGWRVKWAILLKLQQFMDDNYHWIESDRMKRRGIIQSKIRARMNDGWGESAFSKIQHFRMMEFQR